MRRGAEEEVRMFVTPKVKVLTKTGLLRLLAGVIDYY